MREKMATTIVALISLRSPEQAVLDARKLTASEIVGMFLVDQYISPAYLS
jgi:hypothetical protein